MSAILRASGINFDVDTFLATSTLSVIKVYRSGESALPKSQPDGRKNLRSGVNIEVSSADFSHYQRQFKDATLFLARNAAEVTRLRTFNGVESLCIDFGAEIFPPGFSCFRFPHQLLRVAGSLQIDLELSVYPRKPKDETDGDVERATLDEAYDEFTADTKINTGEQFVDDNPS